MVNLAELIRMGPKELSEFLANAADWVAPDDHTRKKVLVGLVLGGLGLGTFLAFREYQKYLERARRRESRASEEEEEKLVGGYGYDVDCREWRVR